MADVANVSASSGKPGRGIGDGAPGRWHEVPDEGLFQRLADGEAEAVGLLYDRYGGLTYSFARSVCADDRCAEDAVREAFVTLWRDPQRFDPGRGDLVGWLLVTVHREALDLLRLRGTARRRALFAAGERDGWSLPACPDGGSGGRQVSDALARLPTEQRRALVLAFYGGFTQPEIAVLTGASTRAIGSLLYGAMRRLRRMLLPLRWAAADFVGHPR